MNVVLPQHLPSDTRLTGGEWFIASDESFGPWPGFPARDLIRLYDPKQFELFVGEWAKEALPKRYARVRIQAGPADKGRDVIGYVSEDVSSSDFDVYQCKHYPHPLTPSDVWTELGKLCYQTFTKAFRIPRLYYFVAPQGVGSSLHELLENPDKLRSNLISNWATQCARKITSTRAVPLTGEMLAYINSFDFSIVRELDPDTLIAQHRETRWHAVRFGRGHLVRPKPIDPPPDVGREEHVYVRQLLDAYSDHLRAPIFDILSLSAHPQFAADLARQRIRYFRAASLHQFERDTYPDDRHFVDLADEIHRGVFDVYNEDCESAYQRLRNTINAARNIPITKYPLREFLDTDDKAGICHHLVNDGRFTWCRSGIISNSARE